MVYICKEDVFEWFNKLSGGKRIELICGLLNMCIPLEWRFFATFLEQAAKKDYSSLKEAELRANSCEEFEKLAAMDWLSVDARPVSVNQVNSTNANDFPDEEFSNQGSQNSLTSSGDGSNSSAPPKAPPVNDANLVDRHLSSVRSKVVVYLCLLSSTNRICATIAFKAIRQQLCLENVTRHIFGSMIGSMSNLNLQKNASCREPQLHPRIRSSLPVPEPGAHFVLDDKLYSEIVLLHTLAIHHPAFTFDQQTLLSEQLQKVQQWMDAVMFAASATVNASSILGSVPPPLLPSPPPPPATDLRFSMTSKPCKSVKDFMDCRSLAAELPKVDNKIEKANSPVHVCREPVMDPCNCDFLLCQDKSDIHIVSDPDSTRSVSTTPSTTPPPSSISNCPNLNIPNNGHPPTLSLPHPCWFCVPPPPLPPPHGPILNTFSPAQITEHLFQYYYALAMTAASSFRSQSNPYWNHCDANNTYFSGASSLSSSGVNSLAQAAATFHSPKSTPVNLSCYNCGAYGHHGNECKLPNFEEQLIKN